MAPSRMQPEAWDYRIDEPSREEAPAAAPSVTLVREEVRGEAAAPAAKEARPEAILVVHGMGQQVPFETLDQVLVGLRGALERESARRVARGEPALDHGDLRVDRVHVEEEDLRYVDIRLEGRRIHLYESYWAPLTEGKVRLRDVVSFMVRGGVNGLRTSFGGFQRWVFGATRRFDKLPRKSGFFLTGMLITVLFLLLGALALMNLVLVAIAANAGKLPGGRSLDELRASFGHLFVAYAAVLLPLVVLYLWSGRVRGGGLRRGARAARDGAPRARATGAAGTAAAVLVWTYLAVALLATFAVAVSILLLLWRGPTMGAYEASVQSLRPAPGVGEALAAMGACASDAPVLARCLLSFVDAGAALAAWAGGFFLGTAVIVALTLLVFGFAARFLRTALVQYLGDVAVYVSPHKLDGFADARKAIRDCVRRTARAVYARPGPEGEPLHERVHVVAHSLGSVAAYDALNALLDEDARAPATSLRVDERTRLLLTFGSPLDKISFLYGTNSPRTGATRAALAAVAQPMIRDYARYRRFDWVNVYSRHDIISGRLDFYDDPAEREREPPRVKVVRNLRDPQAFVPLASHTHYWGNEMVWDELVARLV